MIRKVFISLALLLQFFHASAAHIDTVSVYSRLMHKYVAVVIVSPGDSISATNQQAKLLMLMLHGYGGNQFSWLKNGPGLEKYADSLSVIFICPDGSVDSWYIDQPVLHSYYETFITQDLTHYIDSAYKIPSLNRGICGVSMGGQGALRLALKNQHLYAAAVGLSGVVDLHQSKLANDLIKRFGENETDTNVLSRLSVSNLIKEHPAKNLRIWVSCGTSDYLYESNVSFCRAHQLSFYAVSGMHTWDAFNKGFNIIFPLLYAELAR